jgi:hypothetical protein
MTTWLFEESGEVAPLELAAPAAADDEADTTTFGLAAAFAILGGVFTLSVGGPTGAAVACFLGGALFAGIARRPR